MIDISYSHVCTSVNSVLNQPSAGALIAKLTELEERVTHCKVDMAKEQEAYEDVCKCRKSLVPAEL